MHNIATLGGVERLWDSFEKKFWFSWDVWDKWDKNGKILFNLTKLHLTVSKSLLTQEFLYFFMVMPFYIINERVCTKVEDGGAFGQD